MSVDIYWTVWCYLPEDSDLKLFNLSNMTCPYPSSPETSFHIASVTFMVWRM